MACHSNPESPTTAAFTRHCIAGNIWPGTPTGSETTLADLPTYVATPPNASSTTAILLIHDAAGWQFRNLRLLADYYSTSLSCPVYMPDFFHGETLSLPHLLEGRFAELDMAGFTARNGKEQRRHEIFAAAAALKIEKGVKKLGSVGFCFGGWAVFSLAAQRLLPDGTVVAAVGEANSTYSDGSVPLVDAISTAHPTWLTKQEIDNTRVPTQILAPEFDEAFSQELKDYACERVPKLGVEWNYRYFPGQVHAFATRGGLEVEGERRACERAKRGVVGWFEEIFGLEGERAVEGVEEKEK